MRILQMLTTISYGDAVGNDTLAIRKILREQGYKTGIYADNIDRRLAPGTAAHINKMPRLKETDLLIYHASTGTRLNYDLPAFPGKKVMIYHNITPGHFYRGYSDQAEKLSRYGYEGIRFLKDKVDYCIADSGYNKQELQKMGYQCPIDVCPILIPFEDYNQAPDQAVMDLYQDDGYTNLLFVGRIAPNKRQEDIIRAFYVYQKVYNSKSRLFLIGSSKGMETYEFHLKEYAKKIGVADKVVFSGHIKFNAILAYYKLANVFVCMSEHEGFCVPVVEAMYFDTPIVAYCSSAVPETMAKGGLLLEEKDPYLTAAAIHRIVQDEGLRKEISAQQKKRLKDFSYDAVRNRLLECLKNAM